MHSSLAQATQGSAAEPATAEEAMMATLMSLGRRLRQRHAEDEIDFSAIHVLKTLWHHGPLRLSALAGQLELDASTISRHARQLEDRGLLERTDDPDDGRASRVALTDEGLDCLRKGARVRLELISRVLEDWPDADREQLRVLLTRFQNDLTHQDTEENS